MHLELLGKQWIVWSLLTFCYVQSSSCIVSGSRSVQCIEPTYSSLTLHNEKSAFIYLFIGKFLQMTILINATL